MEGIKNFNEITNKTANSEKAANNKDSVVKQNNDKNAELEEFKKGLKETAPELEKTPSADTVSFLDDKKEVKENQKTEEDDEKKASTLKKCLVGLASLLIPGSGQAINGQWGKAAGFFSACAVPTIYFVKKIMNFENPNLLLCRIPIWVSRIWSVIDAFRNAKSKDA